MNKYQVVLDIITEIKSDPSKIAKVQKEVEAAFKNVAISLNLDKNDAEKAIKDFNQLLNLSEKELNELEDSLKNIDIDLNTEDAQKEFAGLINKIKELSNIDLSGIFDGVDIPEEAFQESDKALKGIKDNGDIKKLAADYDKLEQSIKSQLETQKKALKMMEATGQTGSDAYKKLKNEIKQSEQELEKLSGQAKEAKSFLDRMATFGLAAQGIQQVADSLSMFTGDYIELDTAIQKIKTLGGAAKELAPSFREVSLSLSKEIPISSVEIANATYDALSAGIKATKEDIEAFMKASGKLAVGGAETIGNSVNVLSSLLNAYGLAASETERISDELFTTINLGKTTLPELSSSLSQVIPTAAAMGVEFKNVGASLAIMTANGIPTAMATTKLNAMFVELQKPSQKIEQALTKAGLSVKDFGDMIKKGDYAGALGVLKQSFDEMGISATQAFSSTEASAAFNTLTKDMSKLEGTIFSFNSAAGATQSAFEDMADGVSNKLNALKSTISNIFIGINDIVGPSFATIVGAAQQLAPIMITLQGLGTMLPIGRIGEMATALVSKLVPGLIVTEGAQKSLNLAVLANPYVIAIAGIAALVVALHELSDLLHETAKERQESMEAEAKALDGQLQATEKKIEMAKKQQELVEAFKKEGEAAMENNQLLLRLSQTYPGVIDKTKSYKENLENLEKASKKTGGELDKLSTNLVDLQKNKLEMELKLTKVKVDVKKEEIEDVLTDAFGGWGTDISEIFGTSIERKWSEQITQKYMKAIYSAKTDEELQNAVADFQMALFNDNTVSYIDDNAKSKVLSILQDINETQSEVLKQRNELINKSVIQINNSLSKGLISEKDAIKAIATQFKISEGEAKKLLETQKQQTDEAGKTADAVGGISTKFTEVKENAEKAFNSQKGDLIQMNYAIKELEKQKSNEKDKEKVKLIDEQIKKVKQQMELKIQEARNVKSELDALENIQKETEGLFETKKKASGTTISLFEKKKEEVEALKNANELQLKEYEVMIKQKALAEGRNINEYDKLMIQMKSLELNDKLNEGIKSIYSSFGKINEGNVIEFKAKLSTKEKTEIQKELFDIANDLNSKKIEINSLVTELKLDNNKLREDIQKLEKDKIIIDLELNITNTQKVTEYITKQTNMKETLLQQIEYLNKELYEAELKHNERLSSLSGIDKLKADYDFQNSKKTTLETIKELNQNLQEVEKDTTEVLKKYYEVRNKNIDDWYKNQKERLDLFRQANEKTINDIYTTTTDVAKTTIDEQLNQDLANLDKQKEERLKSLQDLGKLAISTTFEIENEKTRIEKEANEQRLKLQEEANRKKLEQEQMLKGALLEMQREKDAEALSLEVQKLEKEVALNQEKYEAFVRGDIDLNEDELEKIVKTSELLDEQKKLLEQKGTELGVIANLASEQIQEAMSGWFKGDPDAMEKSARQFFNMIKGIIEKKIIAYILELVLSQGTMQYLSSLPFPLNILSVPIITATITGGVKAITSPLLNQLSFASGGVIDKPTMAVIGDGAKLGGENKEWIFRNEQLKTLVSGVVMASNYELKSELQNLRNILENQKLQTSIKGEDIVIAINRTNARISERIY